MSIFRRIKRSLTGERESPAVAILMYHRVHIPRVDPWQLSVHPDHFEDQLRCLGSSYPLLSLNQLPSFLAGGRGEAICLSFDDGYQDNYRHALPLLRKFRAPASFLICTGMTGSRYVFWWDELADLMLHETADKDWHYPMPPVNARQQAFLSTWSAIRQMHPDAQQEAMAKIRSGARGGTAPEDRPMNAGELREIAGDPLFTLGAHTVNHPALDQWDEDFQRAELLGSKSALQTISGAPVGLLGYPFGAYNETTRRLAAESGFQQAVTTRAELVRADTDPLAMGRFQVTEMNGRKLLERVRGYFLNQS